MEDRDSPEFSDDWQENDWQAEDPGISPDELYQILLSQEQQFQDFGLVLQQMTSVMQQTHNPPPNYQPLLEKMVNSLVEAKQKNQQLQSSINSQQEALRAVKSEIGHAQQQLSEVINKTTTQAKILNDRLGWSATLCYGAIGLLTAANLLMSYQLFSSSTNTSLEKKIDTLNARVEKMLKKGR